MCVPYLIIPDDNVLHVRTYSQNAEPIRELWRAGVHCDIYGRAHILRACLPQVSKTHIVTGEKNWWSKTGKSLFAPKVKEMRTATRSRVRTPARTHKSNERRASARWRIFYVHDGRPVLMRNVTVPKEIPSLSADSSQMRFSLAPRRVWAVGALARSLPSRSKYIPFFLVAWLRES